MRVRCATLRMGAARHCSRRATLHAAYTVHALPALQLRQQRYTVKLSRRKLMLTPEELVTMSWFVPVVTVTLEAPVISSL